MPFDFDKVIDRSHSHSTKWLKFAPDVLPFWVADMDFAAPQFLLDALHERLEHPILGYTDRPPSLVESLQRWLEHHYAWSVPEEWIVWVPGVVPMLNLAARSVAPDTSLLMPTPVYHPFLALAANAGISDIRVPMSVRDGQWRMDFDAMAEALQPDTRMLMTCNPQNPTGRCYTSNELAELARFIDTHDLYLVSDEIHCNIVLDSGQTHLPIAAQHPEIAARTISLYSPTKVYNIPGISCAAAIIPDPTLRQNFLRARAGLQPGIGPLGFVACERAFNDRSSYIDELMAYLRANLAELKSVVGDRLLAHDATYLAWIDVADLDIEDTQSHFASHGIGISPGAQFGDPSHIRFNFGCPRETLQAGLQRLGHALADAGG
jgi:cystathionine beta-lyase